MDMLERITARSENYSLQHINVCMKQAISENQLTCVPAFLFLLTRKLKNNC
jgi:hypothetical protein